MLGDILKGLLALLASLLVFVVLRLCDCDPTRIVCGLVALAVLFVRKP